MSKFIKFTSIMTLLILLHATALLAQSGVVIMGKIVDSSGLGVIGATVLEKGTMRGTITNLDGEFHMTVSSNDASLSISYIGYKAVDILVSSPTLTNIVLETDQQQLDEVVVIGYGSVKKSDLSGSVVAIKPEELNRGAVTSPQELLQGKVSGLSVIQGSGEPGAGSTIRIRSGASLNASNDPLIVIDGVPVSNDLPGVSNPLSTINPNDIASMTVLKDASATAIYGSRASNGVIIVTTKKGGSGKPIVSYSSTYSIKHNYNSVNMMNGDEFRNAISTQYAGTASERKINELLNIYPDASTGWQEEIFQLGLSTDQNIAVAGKAADILPYRASFGYNNEKGTLKTSDYERFTGAVNLSPKFFDDHLSIDVNAKGTYTSSQFADSGAVGSAIYYDPTKPLYANDMNGYLGYYNHTSQASGLPNMLAGTNPMSMLYNVDNAGSTTRFIGNAQINYKIHGFEDLRANLNLGYDYAQSLGNKFDLPGSFQTAKNETFKNIGQGHSWDNERKNNLLDVYLNYVKDIDSIKSRVDVMAGYSWQHFYSKDFNNNMSNTTAFVGDREKQGWIYNEKDQRYFNKNSYPQPKENYLVSFFGRMNYSFDDRYLLTATLRRDGSSRFSENNRWGMFPSAALAWTLTNEKFMSGAKSVLSNLKFRVGYGVTGQQEIGDYLYLTKYIYGSDPTTSYLGQLLFRPDGYSPDLKWEETTTFNVGIDYGFLNNRINGSIEFYIKDTDDLLNNVSAPAGTNFSNIVLANVGAMENQGIEFSINATAIQAKDFRWELGYNITLNSSEITKLTANFNPNYPGISATSYSRHQVGGAPYNFWLYEQVYDESGNPIQNTFVDRNKDGKITEDDRYFTGKSPMADLYMGLSSQFIYKNWDLGFNLRANIGNYAYNSTFASNSTLDNYGDNDVMTNYNKDAISFTGFTDRNTDEQRASDLFLEDASFLKMDNITLGYSFEDIFKSSLSGRFSFSVQNVFTITKYSGLDPEIPGVDGVDNVIWPRPRTFTLGLNLNF